MQLDEEVWEPDEFREPARLGREPAAGPHGRPAHAVHEAEAEASAATATTATTAQDPAFAATGARSSFSVAVAVAIEVAATQTKTDAAVPGPVLATDGAVAIAVRGVEGGNGAAVASELLLALALALCLRLGELLDPSGEVAEGGGDAAESLHGKALAMGAEGEEGVDALAPPGVHVGDPEDVRRRVTCEWVAEENRPAIPRCRLRRRHRRDVAGGTACRCRW